MNAQMNIDFDAALTRRDEGIKTAIDHAEAQIPEWTALALAELRRWILATGADTFMLEQFRLASERNIPLPPDRRAWGAVTLRAVRAGWIEKAGYGMKTGETQHRCPGTIWRVIRGKL